MAVTMVSVICPTSIHGVCIWLWITEEKIESQEKLGKALETIENVFECQNETYDTFANDVCITNYFAKMSRVRISFSVLFAIVSAYIFIEFDRWNRLLPIDDGSCFDSNCIPLKIKEKETTIGTNLQKVHF